MRTQPAQLARLAAALGAIVGITVGFRRAGVTNAATLSTTFLLVVLLVATRSRFWVALAAGSVIVSG